MTLPLQITFRHMNPSPALEARIRRKAAELEQISDRITSCRVVVESRHRAPTAGQPFRGPHRFERARLADGRRPQPRLRPCARRCACRGARCFRGGAAPARGPCPGDPRRRQTRRQRAASLADRAGLTLGFAQSGPDRLTAKCSRGLSGTGVRLQHFVFSPFRVGFPEAQPGSPGAHEGGTTRWQQ
jgi:sigma 54 modulation/S30EA-like ribosomal protein